MKSLWIMDGVEQTEGILFGVDDGQALIRTLHLASHTFPRPSLTGRREFITHPLEGGEILRWISDDLSNITQPF